MPLQGKTTPLIPSAQRGGLNIKPLVSQIKDRATATAFDRVQDWVDQLERAARKSQSIEELMLTSPDGRLVFWAGDRAYDGVRYSGSYSREFYAGGDDPPSSPLYTDRNGRLNVTLGDAEDVGGIVVKDADGNVVVEIGMFDTDKYGIYAANAWFGTTPDDALVSVEDGELDISGGNIYVGPGPTGKGGNLYVYDSTDVVVELGTFAVAAPVVVSTSVAGTVNTSAPHGLALNDWTRIAGSSNATHNRVWEVTAVGGPSTFSVTGMTGSGAGGTSTQQDAGAWTQILRAGGTSSVDAPLVTADDGSLRIGVAGGSRIDVSAVGDVTLTDATLQLDGPSGSITIDPAGASITVYGTTYEAELINGVMGFRVLGGGNPSLGLSNQNLIIMDSGGSQTIILDDNLGIDTTISYKIGGTVAIDNSRNGDFANVSVSGVYKVGGTQVLTSQQSPIADATYTPNATPVSYDMGKDNLLFALQTQLSTTLNALRIHGIIAT
jgi:hypothetical protein